MLYKYDFFAGIGSFCCEKVEKKVIFESMLIFGCDDGVGGGIDGVGGGSDDGGGGSDGGGVVDSDSTGGNDGGGEGCGGGISGSDIISITLI